LRFLFDDYTLDTRRRELRRGPTLLHVEPQVFDLLEFLVGNRNRVVSKDDLLATVWGGRIVSESTLASRINAARRSIGDNGEQQRRIRTIIGKGVRFVGAVGEQQDIGGLVNSTVVPPLSIVVLPFTNLSNDPQQEYFADGITDDLTTDLSRMSGSFVIARNTAFTYKG
jgi:DNA-binding winged helix-turn-helix (wHTH) protein